MPITTMVAGSQLVDGCLGCTYHENTSIVAMAAEIYVGIVSLKWKGIVNCTFILQIQLHMTVQL